MNHDTIEADVQLALSVDELRLILAALRAYDHNSSYRELRERLLQQAASSRLALDPPQAA